MNVKHPAAHRQRILLWLGILVGLALLAACQRGDIPVQVAVDGQVIHHRTSAPTVRDLLAELNITLGERDRVNPDLYRTVTPNMTVRIIRVTETTRTETVSIPFERRVVVNEALPVGEERLAQLGVNGEEEIVTRITFEDGVEVSRAEVSRTLVKEPVEEIVVVGGKGNLPPVPFEGLVAYLSGGNAWLMKGNSAARRPLTTEGDLDGRVFDLSPDGGRLLYTRLVTDALDAPLNEVWQVNTRIVGEAPVSLPLHGVLYAQWSPRVTESVIAYSTAERVPASPGWRARNDLWLWDTTTPPTAAEQIVPPNTRGLYPWWGTTFAWSPDGRKFAYANASQVGVIDVLSRTVTPLAEFAPYETGSEWVWVPAVAWSPDSRFIAAVLHGPPTGDERPEASEAFDLWLLSADGSLRARVWEQAGMWSNPVWHGEGIAFGRAVNPLRSVDSRYTLMTMDHDGSNPRRLFPPTPDQIGLQFPEVAWQPGGESAIFVHQNNLFLLTPGGAPPRPLTTDGQSRMPRWVIPPSPVSPSAVLTGSVPLTGTEPVTRRVAISSSRSVTLTTEGEEQP
ncbi:MAG: DUF348 domain-containing protein [Caldilineae bacterium]|nr:MAG: DUF348 domain-containing protein [Caldilineae bacterium]